TSLSSFKQDSGVRGLLGSDVLSSFGSITINYGTNARSGSYPLAQQPGADSMRNSLAERAYEKIPLLAA
ncbi:MAG TPA: hypothetical protein VFU63_14895, partial [Ktedonobacterales bacterium]|nr:hypothetical protein [Ktedonobacterales bacterium]